MEDSTGTIIVCGVVTMGAVMVNDVSKGKLTIKPVIAGFLLTGALLVISTFVGDLARGLAIVTMVTALLLNGTPLFQLLGKVGQVNG